MKKTFSVLFALLLLLCGLPAFAETWSTLVVDGVAVPEALLQARLSTASVMGISMTDDEKAASEARAKEAVLTALVEEQVCLNDAEKRGIRLEGQIQQDAEERYNQSLRSVTSYILSSYPDLEGEELEEQIDAMLKVSGGDRATYRLMAERSALLEAWRACLFNEMENPTEEEIQARYDALLAEQSEKYTADENAFESAVLNGQLVLCRPVTLKMIQKAEFLFDSDAISIIRTTRMYNEEAAAEMEADQYARLDEIALPIYDQLTQGQRDFASVLEELQAGSSAKYNYFHTSSTRFSEDYYSRAAAFTTPGEISTMYKIRNGYAILYYAGDLEACAAVPLDEVREQITAMLKSERFENYEQATKEKLLSEAVIEYPEE